ncbi:MAG: xanthine dehydrogenase small subunit [Geminicoccaceae bacterium]|nr:MAG: xanthine dehydrogenase small subunit [Geminicoccaceae bacterium]
MRLRFLLNGAVQEVEAHPSRLLLGWLRETAGLTGTKEGCGEGDCGACTVALGDLDEEGALRWRAVNACILFLGQVDGKAVLTVEGVAQGDGTLHPVQQALVQQHASQCGFCTPGFVMTLFTHWWRLGPTDRASLDDLLAGNLCRCTGYRPILDAARAALALPGGDRHRDEAWRIVRQLRAWHDRPPLARGFVAPRNLDALADHLAAHPGALLLAGGTDAGLWVTKDLRDYDHVVHLGEVAELRRIGVADGHLQVGAAATYTDLLPHAQTHWPAFADLLRRLGSELIRNSATLGGNLGSASPIGDTLPVLLALDATLVLRHGERRWTLPVDRFFLDYKRTALPKGGFVERIDLPLPPPDLTLHVTKVAKRFDQDISAVLLATAFRHDGHTIHTARIGIGGMAATPARARSAEARLEGAPLTPATFQGAAAALASEFQPLTDLRASAGYRLEAARAALLQAGAAAMGDEVALPLEPVA